MTTLPWWKQSTVYQVYPRSFYDSNGDGIGDLNGITEKLPYIQKLGADVVWLSPIYQSPNDDNGYDISDYRSIMAEFGTMTDFDRLLETAHALGLRVVLDLVANHTSDEHPWFVESRKSKDNPYRDYYIWRDPKNSREPNNWGSCFAGSAWQFDETTGQYYLHLFSKKQPDLNWDNPKVREEIFSMMRWWLDKGIDGFRMDVISLISKKPGLPDGEAQKTGYTSFNVAANGPRVHEYLQEMRQKALAPYDTLTVGECSGVTLEEAKKYANSQGTELSMVFQFEHTDMDFLDLGHKWGYQKVDLVRLKQILSKWQIGLRDVAWNSLFWQNHDQPRIINRLGDPVHYHKRSAKALAICLHLMQGTPYVYQGEELGMTNYPFQTLSDFRDLDSINAYHELVPDFWSPEEMMDALRYKSRDNARTPMQWDDSPQAGFTTGTPWMAVNPNYRTLNVQAALADPDSIFYTYQKLIALRKTMPFLALADYRLLLPDDPALFVYERQLEGQCLLVVCNLSGEERPFTVPKKYQSADILIQNTSRAERKGALSLVPFEAFALFCRG